MDFGSAPWEAKVQAERERWEEERQASSGPPESLWNLVVQLKQSLAGTGSPCRRVAGQTKVASEIFCPSCG